MTATNQYGRPAHGVVIQEYHLPPEFAQTHAITRRRETLLEFDPLVRAALPRLSTGVAAPTVELTLYDAIYPANPHAGGHWTVASLWMGFMTHAVRSYTVTLMFDERHEPSHFVVHGARDAASADVSAEALGAAIEQAQAAGALHSVATHVFHSFGL